MATVEIKKIKYDGLLELEPGMKVQIKNRGGRLWNSHGHMDQYMGKILTIKNIEYSITYGIKVFTTVEAVSYDNYHWQFSMDDIDYIVIEKQTDIQGEILNMITKVATTNCSKSDLNFPLVDKYIVNGKAVVVLFKDGTKEKVVCTEGDTFDLEIGIEKCLLKKLIGDDFKNKIQALIRRQEKAEKENEARIEREKEERKVKEEKRQKANKKRLERQARKEAMLQMEIENQKKKLSKRLNESKDL